MLVKDPQHLPPSVPYPSIQYSPTSASGQREHLVMASGRSRQVRVSTHYVKDVVLTWYMTPDEYSAFMAFWKDVIHTGDDIFVMELLDGHLAPPKIVILSVSNLKASKKGSLWSVTTPAQLVPENPYLFLPLIEETIIDGTIRQSLNPTETLSKRTKVDAVWDGGSGEDLTYLSDDIVPREGGGFTRSGEYATTQDAKPTSTDVKKVTVRADPIIDESIIQAKKPSHGITKLVTIYADDVYDTTSTTSAPVTRGDTILDPE